MTGAAVYAAGMNTTADALRSVRPRGRIIQIGIGRPEATIDLFTVLTKKPSTSAPTSGLPTSSPISSP
ncbi:hypothetical protein [Nonomuraea longicatena]|uniref:Alcohol dehydrogenase n=1 Tax=Nonomuraea longicatena TaxID=83682 RepID=A0ABP4A5T3_9ACTN